MCDFVILLPLLRHILYRHQDIRDALATTFSHQYVLTYAHEILVSIITHMTRLPSEV